MSAQIILGPRPGKKSKDSIQAQGVTDILTLLSPREQPDAIAKIAKAIGATWHHFPIDGGHLDTLSEVDPARLFLVYDEIVRAAGTADPENFEHCSAGIHRTCCGVYLLLRYRGLTAEAAEAELVTLRPVTSEQVGQERVELAEAKFVEWQAR